MTITNRQILTSQGALQTLLEADVEGLYALQLRDIVEAIESRAERLQEVRQDLMTQVDEETITSDEADEEWDEVLDDDHDLDHEQIPESAIERAEISAADVMALDWLLERE